MYFLPLLNKYSLCFYSRSSPPFLRPPTPMSTTNPLQFMSFVVSMFHVFQSFLTRFVWSQKIVQGVFEEMGIWVVGEICSFIESKGIGLLIDHEWNMSFTKKWCLSLTGLSENKLCTTKLAVKQTNKQTFKHPALPLTRFWAIMIRIPLYVCQCVRIKINYTYIDSSNASPKP